MTPAAPDVLLGGYVPYDDRQATLRDEFLTLWAASGRTALDRSQRPGHLTASAFVLSADGRRVVLHHHRKLGRWLQLGGHADGDTDLARVAQREATEECGMHGLAVAPDVFDLDVHEVAPPGETPHLHYDVRFVVRAPEGATPVCSAESHAIAWFTLTDAVDVVDEPQLRAVIHRLELPRRG